MPPLVATTEIHVNSHTCYHELECNVSLIYLYKQFLCEWHSCTFNLLAVRAYYI